MPSATSTTRATRWRGPRLVQPAPRAFFKQGGDRLSERRPSSPTGSRSSLGRGRGPPRGDDGSSGTAASSDCGDGRRARRRGRSGGAPPRRPGASRFGSMHRPGRGRPARPVRNRSSLARRAAAKIEFQARVSGNKSRAPNADLDAEPRDVVRNTVSAVSQSAGARRQRCRRPRRRRQRRAPTHRRPAGAAAPRPARPRPWRRRATAGAPTPDLRRQLPGTPARRSGAAGRRSSRRPAGTAAWAAARSRRWETLQIKRPVVQRRRRSDARADSAWIALRNASRLGASLRKAAAAPPRRAAASRRSRRAPYVIAPGPRGPAARRPAAIFARPAATASASTSGGRAGARLGLGLPSASARLACARRARDAASAASTRRRRGARRRRRNGAARHRFTRAHPNL